MSNRLKPGRNSLMPHVKSGTAGIVAMGSTPDEFRASVGEEIARWRKVITDAGIKMEP